MNTQRRLTVAAAVGSVVVCVVAACSSGSKTGQGSLGNLSNPSLSPAPGASAPVTALPTVTPKGSHSTHGNSSAPASSQPSGQPSGVASSFGHATFRAANNFSVVATDRCYWNLFNDAGNIELQVGAEFTITYSGLFNPTQVNNFNFSNNLDGYHTEGPAQLGTTVHYTGGQLLNVSPLAGAHVQVTGTIEDTDDSAADNKATVTVSMPTASQITASGLTNGSAPCS